MATIKIEVDFGAPVRFPDDWDRRLCELLQEVCDLYTEDNPTEVMWVSGYGDKPIWNEPNEPTFDASVFHIECFAREGHPKELARRAVRNAKRAIESESAQTKKNKT